jgi:hypothetical protein
VHAGANVRADPWNELFAEVEELEKLTPGSQRFRQLEERLSSLASERDRAARKQRDALELFHARVLRASVQRIASGPISWRVTEPGVPVAWVSREPWLAARVLVPGGLRADALRLALAESGVEAAGTRSIEGVQARLDFAARAAAEDVSLFQLDAAERIARTLHERARSAESARRLARILTQRGAAPEAEALLGAALANADGAETIALYLERARVRFAAVSSPVSATGSSTGSTAASNSATSLGSSAGAMLGALHDLGAAFARDSVDAGLQLARNALDGGSPDRARAVAGSILAAEAGNPEALRLWGLSLVASARRMEPGAPPAADGTVR